MGFVHYTLVGHFNPGTVYVNGEKNLAVARPLDSAKIDALLGEYPAVVAAQVRLLDGYARCQWAPSTHGEEIVEFAYRLARLEGCLAVENGQQVTYPPEAVRAQAEVHERAGGPPGLARQREADARRAADAFEEKLRRRAASESPRKAQLARALDEIKRRRFAHAERAGCFVKDDQGWPGEEVVRETLDHCGGDHAVTEELLNRRFLMADLLDALAPGEAWAAADLREAANALAAALERQLREQFPKQRFAVEIVGAALAEEEPAEVSVTFHRAG
ncbi:MAG: hypothetical protein QM820_28350 [Minicystis sp.]